MSKPLTVSIPHRLGKEEALRRLKSGLANAHANFGQFYSVQEETWTGDHLQFRVSALGQAASGSIDVAEDHVRLEVVLPWLLAKIAEKVQPLIRKEGTLMLEKKQLIGHAMPGSTATIATQLALFFERAPYRPS